MPSPKASRPPAPLRATFAERIRDLPADAWDACARAAGGDPFLSYGFLRALEDTDCATERAGWAPRHLALYDDAGALRAVAPMYLKGHSQGEYVFDHGWAEAFERAGGDYYPKALCAVPFTPATGPRLMPAPDAPQGARDAALGAMLAACEKAGVSSLHLNFARPPDLRAARAQGMLTRFGVQRSWRRAPSWRNYDDFLAALTSRRRKALRRERAKAREGLRIRALVGDAVQERHWDAFYACYLETASRKWGDPYLNREAFAAIAAALGDNLALVAAFKPDGAMIAGAMHVFGPGSLRGRYWGCLEARPFLHFELCYHMALEIAFEHGGIRRVEAGAQGEHKTERGYLPRLTRSAHAVFHPGLRAAVADFLETERAHMRAVRQAIVDHQSPFRARRTQEDRAGD